jgi:hypothetical protein
VSIVLGIGLALLLIAVLAAQFLIFPTMWVGFRDQWRRTPPQNRRRGMAAGGLAAVWIVVGMALSIAEPWGRDSIVYVLGVGGGSLTLLMLVGVAVHGVREVRGARQRRASS